MIPNFEDLINKMSGSHQPNTKTGSNALSYSVSYTGGTKSGSGANAAGYTSGSNTKTSGGYGGNSGSGYGGYGSGQGAIKSPAMSPQEVEISLNELFGQFGESDDYCMPDSHTGC